MVQPGTFASSLLSHLPAGLSLPLQPAQVPKSPRHLLCSSRWVYFTSLCSKAGPQVGVWVLQDGAGAEQRAQSCGLLGGRWKIQNSSARLRLASFFFFLFPRAAEATWWLAYAWEHILLLGMLKIHATIFPFHIPKYINVLVL